MTGVFLKIVNMSIAASYLVLVVILLRIIFKKAPKCINVLLWSIVALRLLFPFTIESPFSLIPSNETIKPTIMTETMPSLHTGIPDLNRVVNPIIQGAFSPSLGSSANPLQIWIPVLASIWVIGVVLLIFYVFISSIRLHKKVETAVLVRDNIFKSENVSSPFVFGIVQPKIYLPFEVETQNLRYIIAHEQTHIQHKDHWWKLLGFLFLAVYWFNPLMWISYLLLCKDIELACDEYVIRQYNSGERVDYAQALLTFSISHHKITARPLAFGEVGVKERVKLVLNYKKPAFWGIIVAMIICVMVVICFLTDPVNKKTTEIVFPTYRIENMDNISFIEQINDTSPFKVLLDLPDGWMIQRCDEIEETTVPGVFFSVLYLYHEDKLMGTIGFNKFEPDTEEMPKEMFKMIFYQAMWSTLSLGSFYQWEHYTSVKSWGTGEVGIADITYLDPNDLKAGAKAEAAQLETIGILAYDTEIKAFVGIAFQPDIISREQAETIAQTLQMELLNKNEEGGDMKAFEIMKQ